METNDNESEAGTTNEPEFFEDINSVVQDADEDLINDMPDAHPLPKPTEN